MAGVYSQWNMEEERDTGEDIEEESSEQQMVADTVLKEVSF
jgi:hypothetical protein